MIWSVFGQVEGGPLCIRGELPLPDVLFEGKGRVCAFFVPLCLCASSSAPSGHQSNQGGQILDFACGTTLAEPAMVPRHDSTAIGSSVANPTEEGPPFPGGRGNLPSPTRVVEPPSVASTRR